MAGEYYNEETLNKVYTALFNVAGFTTIEVDSAILALQNAGILFRERDHVEEKQISDLDPLNHDQWRDGDGVAMTLCAIHEINPDYDTHVQAMSVIGGIAVCKLHLGKLAGYIARGSNISNVLNATLMGEDPNIVKSNE